jgi:hypothetical protein
VDLSNPVWEHGLEPLVDRRSRERRTSDRRRHAGANPPVERRAERDRRVRQRRETVTEHLRNALQVLVHLSVGRTLEPAVDDEVAAVIRRVWLAIQELERHRRH